MKWRPVAGDYWREVGEKGSSPTPVITASTEPQPAQDQPTKALFATSLLAAGLAAPTSPAIPDLKTPAEHFSRQPFVACRLGAWC